MNKILSIMQFLADSLLYGFSFVAGNVPYWVLLVAVLMGRVHVWAAVALFFSFAMARGYLVAFNNGTNRGNGVVKGLWRSVVRPVLYLLFVETAYISLVYLFTEGERLDYIIGLSAFGCFIISYILGRFIKPPLVDTERKVLFKDSKTRIVVIMLWVYALVQPDNMWLSAFAVVAIYVIEYFCMYDWSFAIKTRSSKDDGAKSDAQEGVFI